MSGAIAKSNDLCPLSFLPFSLGVVSSERVQGEYLLKEDF